MQSLEQAVSVIGKATESSILPRNANNDYFNIVSNRTISFHEKSKRWGVIIKDTNGIKIVLDITQNKLDKHFAVDMIGLRLSTLRGISRITFVTEEDNPRYDRHDTLTIYLKDSDQQPYDFENEKFNSLLRRIKGINQSQDKK